ncbi:MAG: KUP/HAK/KT family potassium transporter [Desulfobacterales bacterium]|nr:KUP/HAK/KT family potassium transporter [Desulfobacterales bacterium]
MMKNKASSHPDPDSSSAPKTLTLALGALGIVYGDIGTSPLYAIKECFHGLHAIELTESNILGVLSLVFWSLTVVVSVKYVCFILKADNHGEGGIFALLSLVPRGEKRISPRARSAVVLAGILGAALLYGDGIITPTISVLSAVEGLNVATEAAKPWVLPLTCLILFALFVVQHRGSYAIGRVFGPIMTLWFVIIAILGLISILATPHVLLAINPAYCYEFFIANRLHGMVVLGSVVLCITGAEALYADLGHFNRKAIRVSWLGLVFPALLLNYYGQGAALLSQPELAFNPFYGLVPRPMLYPMVVLSTTAAIIASQAMISGVFSLTQQAVQLGYLPRMRIIHTSEETRGQIYISGANWAMMFACIGLALAFRESSRLAGAYGIAVTATMTATSIIYFFVASKAWHWSLWKAIPMVAIFLFFDLSFFGANLLKIRDGGWFTLSVAAILLIIMTTWKDGREKISRKKSATRLPLENFLEKVAEQNPPRVPGTAVFMTISPVGAPSPLIHHFKHNHVLHEQVILLTIRAVDYPRVPPDERLKFQELGQGFYRLQAFHGFMETPQVPRIMRQLEQVGIQTDPAATTFFLGRETMLTTGRSRMMRWRKLLFAFLSRNVQTPTVYFSLPPERVIELGIELEL